MCHINNLEVKSRSLQNFIRNRFIILNIEIEFLFRFVYYNTINCDYVCSDLFPNLAK